MKNSNFLSKLPNHTIIIIIIFCIALGTFIGIATTVNLVHKRTRHSFKNLLQKDFELSKAKFKETARKNTDIFLKKLSKEINLTPEQKNKIESVLNTQRKEMELFKGNLREKFITAKTNIYKILNKEQKTKIENKN